MSSQRKTIVGMWNMNRKTTEICGAYTWAAHINLCFALHKVVVCLSTKKHIIPKARRKYRGLSAEKMIHWLGISLQRVHVNNLSLLHAWLRNVFIPNSTHFEHRSLAFVLSYIGKQVFYFTSFISVHAVRWTNLMRSWFLSFRWPFLWWWPIYRHPVG